LRYVPPPRDRREHLGQAGKRLGKAQVLSKFWDRSEGSFLAENFGFLSNSFQPLPVSGYPELFTCLTLITREALDNPRFGKDPHAEYVTSEAAILQVLLDGGEPRAVVLGRETAAPDACQPGRGAHALSRVAERTASWRL
jgi:hypothetical protein